MLFYHALFRRIRIAALWRSSLRIAALWRWGRATRFLRMDPNSFQQRVASWPTHPGSLWSKSYIRSSPQAGYEALGNVLRVFPIAWQFRSEHAIF